MCKGEQPRDYKLIFNRGRTQLTKLEVRDMSTTYFTKAVLLLTFLGGCGCFAGLVNHDEGNYVLYVKVLYIYSLSNLVSRASCYTTVKCLFYFIFYFFMPTHKLRGH